MTNGHVCSRAVLGEFFKVCGVKHFFQAGDMTFIHGLSLIKQQATATVEW